MVRRKEIGGLGICNICLRNKALLSGAGGFNQRMILFGAGSL